jgi:predicted GNAT family N-acyltransferase
MPLTLVSFHADDALRMAAAHRIRQVVFCDEQGVSAEEEWDGKDALCEHFLLLDDLAEVGCARMRPYGPRIFKIERVAVVKHRRNTGAGKAIMLEILKRYGDHTLVMNAQLAVEGFYSALGFVSEGEVFEEANIAHVHMVRRP